MNVIFYNFSKRSNSTKQPGAGDTGTTLSCELKEQSSIVNPTLVIKNVAAGLSTIWNYARIATFDRYYFINNWRWLNGVWECDLICDVLASFKTGIGNLSEYVLRSASQYNGQIVDLQYPTTAETRVDSRLLTNRFQSVFAGGYYILGVISNDQSAAQGAVTYYQMTPAQIAALKTYMMSDDFMLEQGFTQQLIVDYIPTDVLKTLYDPFKYIVSCVWIPLSDTAIPASFKTSENVKFGWWETTESIPGYKINQNGYVATYSERISISGHPQRFDRGVYLDHTPFVDRMLFYPPYGSIPINDDSIIGGDYLRIELTIDLVFGDSVLSVFHDRPISENDFANKGLIARVSAPLAVPIQLAQTTIDYGSSATAILPIAFNGAGRSAMDAFKEYGGGVSGWLAGFGAFGFNAPGQTLSAIGDVIASPVGQLQSAGTNGSVAQYSTHPYFIEKYRIVADDDNTQKGRPLCAIRTINTLSGYIMVDTPDVNLPCMDSERQQIIAFMSGGFFYE